LDFYISRSLKQQSVYRHVTLLGHITDSRANQSLLFLLNAACLAEKQQIPILLSLVVTDQGSNPQSTALEASMPTITPPMQFEIKDTTDTASSALP
jgi:hypothetical protein